MQISAKTAVPSISHPSSSLALRSLPLFFTARKPAENGPGLTTASSHVRDAHGTWMCAAESLRDLAQRDQHTFNPDLSKTYKPAPAPSCNTQINLHGIVDMHRRVHFSPPSTTIPTNNPTPLLLLP